MTTVHFDPMKASGELCRLIQPKLAAHATTAGAVRDRNPATSPIPVANNMVEFTNLLQSILVAKSEPGKQLPN
jgi:hypothetical protein